MIRLQLEKQLDMTSGNKKISLQFDLQKGKTLALYGPSGCGKTSLLRMIAGLMQPDKGKIVGYSSEWYNSTKKIFMPPQLRSVGMVFQDYALFPNMTIEGNLRFAAASTPLLDELLKATDSWSLRHKKPGQLSGVNNNDLLWLGPSFKPQSYYCSTKLFRPWTKSCDNPCINCFCKCKNV